MRRQRRSTPTARRPWLLLGLLVGSLLLACSPVPSSTPRASLGASPSSAPTDVPGDSAAPSDGTGEPTQTETDWGRIWDAVPPAFPRPPGSSDADSIDRSPSSADLSVGAGPTEVTDFYQAGLTDAGYIVSAQGPLEDGSRVIDASRGQDCKLQIVVTPLSGLTHVKILFGAGCPFG